MSDPAKPGANAEAPRRKAGGAVPFTVMRRPPMSHVEVREAREALGLHPRQMAAMLDMTERFFRKLERDPAHLSFKPPPARAVRLLHAYLAGYRPDDWPG